MSECDFSLKILTPTLVHGSDNQSIELRPDFFEDAFKFWWKAITAIENKNEFIKKETTLFGNKDIENGESPLKIRIGYMKFNKSKYYQTLDNGKVVENILKEALMPDSKYSLYLYSRNDIKYYRDLSILTFLLGGIGDKFNKGYGISTIENINFRKYEVNNISKEIIKLLNNICEDAKFYLLEEENKYIIERNSGINVNYPAIEKIEIYKTTTKWEKISDKLDKYILMKNKSEDQNKDENLEVLKSVYVSLYENNKNLYPIITTIKPSLPKGMNLSRVKIDEYMEDFKKYIL